MRVPWRSRRASCAEVSLGNICARRCTRRLFATVAPTDRVESRRELHHQLIDVAPAPMFAGRARRHDGVLRRMEVLGRVPILRVIAATDMPAGPAKSQVHPSIAELEALLATATTWTIGAHKAQMGTLSRHVTSTDLELTNLHPGAQSSTRMASAHATDRGASP